MREEKIAKQGQERERINHFGGARSGKGRKGYDTVPCKSIHPARFFSYFVALQPVNQMDF